ISFPNIDSSGLPATFSKVLINNVLRERLGFEGLIITDDIEMHGAKIIPSVGERAVRAIEAGNDMVMIAWTKKNQKAAYNALLNAVKQKRISEERLNQSLRRILYSKLTHKNNDLFKVQPKLFLSQLKNNLNRLKKISDKVVASNIERFFYLDDSTAPMLDIEQKPLVFTADYRFYQSFSKELKRKSFYYPLSPKKKSPVVNAFKQHATALGIFYITGNGTAKLLNKVPNHLKKQLVVVNSTNPGRVVNRHQYAAVIDINSRNFNSGKWVAQKLENNNIRLPATMDGKKSFHKRKVSQNN
ncbi:MAG: glycoside hydrolase family 3 protein, partial [Bdellovibrionales bacterium]|nr:glycoside hydrolase family 3 protein [Bdellovibrionales bacterium]